MRLKVRSLLSPALGTPTELREAKAEGEERGRAGSHSPKQMERGGPLSAAAAPALSARLLQPSRGRASAGSPTVRIGLWPGPHRAVPAAAPPPAPPLPWPAAPTCCGGGQEGGAREPQGTNCTGDQPYGTQTKRQSHLSSLAPLPPTWSLVPGQPGPPAGHLLSRAPVALEAGPQSCRVGGPLKALSQRKGWRELELSLNSGRSLVFSPSQPSLQ